MKNSSRSLYVLLLFFLSFTTRSQEGIPVYYDYLTDNLTLIHPAMSGASRCSKIRLNGRMQWSGVEDFPALQTLSINSHLASHSGWGLIIFNDRNGYNKQKGAYISFAHHLQLSQGTTLNQLSFGLGVLFSNHQLELENTFLPGGDPVLNGGNLNRTYYNLDAGFAWHVGTFFLIGTAKNLIPVNRSFYPNNSETDNLRHYIVSTGIFFDGNSRIHPEPSVMIQYKEYSNELIGDFNLKFYLDLSATNVMFLGASYRNYFTTSEYQALQDISPMLGVFMRKFMIAYVYTHQLSQTTFSNGGFHQLTLGFNFDCRKREIHYGCPHLK